LFALIAEVATGVNEIFRKMSVTGRRRSAQQLSAVL
jgi:hypothetical protein